MRTRLCANCATRYPGNESRCPECGTHGKASQEEKAAAYPLGYPQCAWEANGERCKLPGSLSSSTRNDPGTQWYCAMHYGCTDPVAGAAYVESSRRHYTHGKSSHADLQEAAAIFCAEKGLHTVEQMRAYIRESVQGMRRKFAQKAAA